MKKPTNSPSKFTVDVPTTRRVEVEVVPPGTPDENLKPGSYRYLPAPPELGLSKDAFVLCRMPDRRKRK